MIGLAPWMPEPDATGFPAPPTYPNCWQWLEPTAVLVSGSNVTTMTDQSGSVDLGGSHSAQDCTTSPSITTGASINGVPALTFPASLTGASCTRNPPYTTFTNVTLFAVITPTGALVDYGRVYDNDFNSSFTLSLNATATAWKFLMAESSSPFGTVEGGVPALNTAVLLTATYNSTTQVGTLQVNGTTVSTGTLVTPTGSSGANVAFGGAVSSGGVTNQPGIYGDGCIFTDCKSGATLVALNRYFGAKYGITVP